MARIYDNIETKFAEGLQGIVSNVGVKRVDFCVGYFNLRGWNLVIDQIDSLMGDYIYENDQRVFRKCRLLIGMHQSDEELVRQLYTEPFLPDANYVSQCKLKIAHDFKKQLQLGLPTKQDELTLRRLSKQMKDEKVCVKLYLREQLHAKLYLAYRPDDNFNKIQAIMGSSNLTYSGLTKQGELNAEFGDSDSAEKLSRWFDDRWNDRFSLDITKELIEIIDNSWAGEKDIPPYYIYLKTVYHLSQEARSGVREFTIPIEFRRSLFEFQQTAVKIAARHLSDKRGGAMIGDVVGLGKTITACAIVKMYENTFGSNALIICPANLQEMWAKYRKQYDLKADIISMAKPIDVDNARFYKLIVVDESHNLRNGQGTRYNNIKDLIHKQDCGVLLLTATPYNKQYKDLSNQLRLFVDDDMDLGIRPEAYIRKIGGERRFAEMYEDPIRSIKAFERSDSPEDWQELMKLFLIRRTRTFIKENSHDVKTDPANGRKYLLFPDGHKSYFPDRIPKAIKFKTVDGDQYSRLYSKRMVDMMESLKLPRYGLIKYLDDKKAAEALKAEKDLIDNLSRAGERMMGFCKSTFFKRIDSSGFAFLLTLYHHILRNAVFIYAIDNKLKLPIGDENTLPEDFLDDGDTNDIFANNEENENAASGDLLRIPNKEEYYMQRAEKYYKELAGKNNVKWIDSKFFKRTLKQQLKKDSKQLVAMIDLCGAWNPKTDQKLKELEFLLNGKHKNDKVIVFSQYADTVNYICQQLKKRGVKHIDKVTGDSPNPTAIVEKFSPKSNQAEVLKDDELRVLIATDVLSEGQNLQDAHVIVNYDLPWAIIRLIQRAGRVDRIGQSAEQIYCYSFFPADKVDEIIHLRTRLNDRINENAHIVGSDEVFFEGNEQNLRDMYNEKSGSLDDDEDDNDVDLGSQAFQIWKNATDANPQLKAIIPGLSNIVYSTKKAANNIEDGVITYARTYNDFDVLTWYNSKGEIVSQSQKRILQAMACSIDEPCLPAQDNHLELVGKAIKDIENENVSVSGALGKRMSTKRQIYYLLVHYREQPITIFFTQEKKGMLKFVIDQIYNNPLLESSRFILTKMLRGNSKQDDIVDTVINMYKNGNLCLVDEDKNKFKDPTIICSMGLKAE